MKQLLVWFKNNQRSFPWRECRTPYAVWISEVMLQQTRANVVIPYFVQWMKRFPDVTSLAEASIEEVIKLWEGLGYYSRARNLHQGAKQLMEQCGGIIPHSKEALASIRGLGPYTINAILSFGFHQRAVAIDGNVTRVISRYFAIDENVCQAHVRKKIEHKANLLLDLDEPWVSAEGLIELGATVCLPKPCCRICPLQAGCLGLKQNIAESLPIKNIAKKVSILTRTVTVIECHGKFLVRKEQSGKIMADLHEFPYFETQSPSDSNLKTFVKKKFHITVKRIRPLKKVIHAFTRYQAHLFPFLMQTEHSLDILDWKWVEKKELSQLPFSSGHRRIMQQL